MSGPTVFETLCVIQRGSLSGLTGGAALERETNGVLCSERAQAKWLVSWRCVMRMRSKGERVKRWDPRSRGWQGNNSPTAILRQALST